jgi:hypothetical protein
MIDEVPLASASAVALAWIPVFLRFVRSWRARSNPISLAICVLIASVIYTPVYVASAFPVGWPTATVIAINTITCATFYITFRYANRKFPDTRRNGA